jgi:YD repeat-containing protein
MGYGGAAGASGRVGRATGDPPGPHALTTVAQGSTNNPQPRLYGYDPNGNMTNIDGLACTWDFKDRLVAVEDAAMRAQYTYDYTDRRITKKVLWKEGQLPPFVAAAEAQHPVPRAEVIAARFSQKNDASLK